MHPPARLSDFLCSAFTVDELRHFVGAHLDPKVLAALPATGTPSECSSALVGLLSRQGDLDHDFFDALTQARPKRRPEIDGLRELFAKGPKVETPQPSGGGTRSQSSPLSREGRITKKLRTCLVEFMSLYHDRDFRAAMRSYGSCSSEETRRKNWTPIRRWHDRWRPWFEVELTDQEIKRLQASVVVPPPSEGFFHRVDEYDDDEFVLTEDAAEDALREIEVVLLGLITKYEPVS